MDNWADSHFFFSFFLRDRDAGVKANTARSVPDVSPLNDWPGADRKAYGAKLYDTHDPIAAFRKAENGRAFPQSMAFRRKDVSNW
jgi:hypothetical protein